MKHYTFKAYLGGCGGTPEEAWENVCESIAVDGLGEFEPDSIDSEEEMEGFDD
jgi:hypothetical protein